MSTDRARMAVSADVRRMFIGGAKESGLGREGGMASIPEMTEVTWVTFQMGRRAFLF